MNNQILIVEDAQDTVELLRYNLEKENYETLIAGTGEDAIDAVQCHEPVIVLLDIMLPGLNGWEVCRILRESSKGKTVPIIMLTAMGDEEARIKGLALGADDYLAKPFSIRELLLKIRKYVGRQHAIEQLRTREREQETSLRYLVHELRNAMTVIGGFSSLALRKEDPAKYLRTIKTSAAHVQSLLDDASLLIRLEKEGGLLPLEPVDVVSIVRDAVDMVRDEAIRKRLEIIVMKNSPVFVRGNRTAVRQVFVNLISNAVKYNREGGRVWIFFDDEPGGLTGVSVKDRGCGIRSEERSKIFEKFYRAVGSELVTGAGLGLYIVKLLTEAMGGKIRVESGQGAGSTFTASFVRADPEAIRPDAQDTEIQARIFKS